MKQLHRRSATIAFAIAVVTSLAPAAASSRPDVPAAGQRSQGAQSAPSTTTAQNAARLHVYSDRIAATAADLPSGASLTAMLPALMQLAATRSAAGNPAEENASALLALAFYVNGWPLTALVPEARTWAPAVPRALRLRGRYDLAQHFTVSALIASAAGTPLATMAGIYKEISDSRGGSGFSFSDIAADQAGTTFGQIATLSAESARRLQQRVGPDLAEDDLMPAIDGLADNMPEAELTRRFGGIGAPAYNATIADIARRIAALPLFRPPVTR